MSKNIEMKAYCSDLDRAKQLCKRLGAHPARDHWQRDTYFVVPRDRLKLRESDKFGNCLIHYRRADLSSLRESDYTKIDLPGIAPVLRDVLASAFGIRIIVEKHRQTYVLDSALINLDTVGELGSFVEIEVNAEPGTEEKALTYAHWLKDQLKLAESDIIPVSYSELLPAYHQAKKWRNRLAAASKPGQLFLIDGPSGSGKSTLATRLRKRSGSELTFARRHCTRAPRLNEEDEYIFVSNDEFAMMARAGDFLEHRNFEFGMSYGLAWGEAVQPMTEGKNVLAIMNWGNARHIRRIFPEAKIILTTASPETLRRRLMSRGVHNPEQLTERLGNAKRFSGDDKAYDLIVSNEDGELENVIAKIVGYIATPSTQNGQNA